MKKRFKKILFFLIAVVTISITPTIPYTTYAVQQITQQHTLSKKASPCSTERHWHTSPERHDHHPNSDRDAAGTHDS